MGRVAAMLAERFHKAAALMMRSKEVLASDSLPPSGSAVP
jgi:hypothetical protein